MAFNINYIKLILNFLFFTHSVCLFSQTDRHGEDDSTRFENTMILIIHKMDNSKFRESKKELDKIRYIIENLSLEQRYKYNKYRTITDIRLNELNDSTEIYDKNIEIATELNDTLKLTDALITRGIVVEKRNYFHTAYTYYKHAQNIAKESNDTMAYIRTAHNIAYGLMNLQLNGLARTTIDNALIYKSEKHNYAIGRLNILKSATFLNTNQNDSAKLYIEKGRALLEKHNKIHGKKVMNFYYGKYLRQVGKIEEATKILTDGRAFQIKRGLTLNSAFSTIELIKINLQQHEYSSAKKSLLYLKGFKENNIKLEYYNLNYILNKKLGDEHNTLYYLKRYRELNDNISMTLQERTQMALQSKNRFSIARKNKKLVTLQNSTKYNLRNKYTKYLIIPIVALFLLIISFLNYRREIKRREYIIRKIKSEDDKNEEIQAKELQNYRTFISDLRKKTNKKENNKEWKRIIATFLNFFLSL